MLIKLKEKSLRIGFEQTFEKSKQWKFFFFDEKLFDIDDVYNSQNDRIWAASRAEADKNGGIKEKRKFPQKFMVWLGACSKGVTPLVILDEGTVDLLDILKKCFQ